jgi:hypothetical protein
MVLNSIQKRGHYFDQVDSIDHGDCSMKLLGSMQVTAEISTVASNEMVFQPETKRTGTALARVIYPADMGEVMGVLEDLWLRMARHPAIKLSVLEEPLTQQSTLLVRLDGNGMDGEVFQLLEAAAHPGNYLWSQCGKKGSLVSDVRWIGSTLVIELAPQHQMQCWPVGDSLVLALQALLQRLKLLGRNTEKSK